ncbi:hypothetical protein [Trueperella bialowiezensis]|uniref:Uncharacterized protein n=1 Tax=Trueperella bialowiezensis TaxID=312285 RepID=A0A448PCU1_9ACTO|nr:hypothetical protein [Trueperella bialowiezensis]VEI12750.1 Uncharacterised protein [Trueperella bialowiezensis]
MSAWHRLFRESTFNPMMVVAFFALLFFAFVANSTERVILLVLAGLLAVAELSRACARRKHDASPDDTAAEDQ